MRKIFPKSVSQVFPNPYKQHHTHTRTRTHRDSNPNGSNNNYIPIIDLNGQNLTAGDVGVSGVSTQGLSDIWPRGYKIFLCSAQLGIK